MGSVILAGLAIAVIAAALVSATLQCKILTPQPYPEPDQGPADSPPMPKGEG